MKKTRVAVAYHFFPHYRKGIIEEFMRSPDVDVTYLGDDKGIEGIKEYKFGAEAKFKAVATHYLGKLVFQPGLLWECLFGPYDCFIFLANPNFMTTWLAAVLCRLRGKRVIFWGHGFKTDALGVNNRVRRFFFGLADGYYTYGWRAKEIALKLGFAPEEIYVGFNSLDYHRQLAVRNAVLRNPPQVTQSGERVLRILCISRLTSLCRYDMLFDAIKIAQQKYGVRASVLMIGDGPVKADLEQQAKTLGLDVDFVGALYDEQQIASHVFAADVTIQPGKVGLTAMHSMMYGTPIISNDDFIAQMPEVEAVVDGFTGLLFKSGDLDDLAARLDEFNRVFTDREKTRQRCFEMIDKIYNPMKQTEVLVEAVQGKPARLGNDAFVLFKGQGA